MNESEGILTYSDIYNISGRARAIWVVPDISKTLLVLSTYKGIYPPLLLSIMAAKRT